MFIVFPNQFKLPNFVTYRTICDVLEELGRISEAIKCFLQFQTELGDDTGNRDGQAQSELGEGSRRRRSDTTDSFHTAVNPEEETESVGGAEWIASEDFLFGS